MNNKTVYSFITIAFGVLFVPAVLFAESLVPQKNVSDSKESVSPGKWSLGIVYPGATLKYRLSEKDAWEVKTQSGSGIFAIGPRYYRYFNKGSSLSLFYGFEADYIGFKGKESKGSGFAGGGFAGGEIFLGNRLSLAMDFGPMYIDLVETEYSQSVGNIEYILNMAIYWHFR